MRRRDFLLTTGAGLIGSAAWSEAGAPKLLAAANDASKRAWLVALDQNAAEVFRLPLPARGHAAAAHPHRAEAVAFARRPGRYGVVLDCPAGCEKARLDLPEDRHFFGHGAFTADGRYLLTTENDFDKGEGRLGVWDTADYARIDDLPSGGIGPHEIIRLPDGGFAVANGGILTHPDFGRAKLNLPTMRPNLSYLSADGRLLEVVKPPEAQRQNSIRHIDVDAQGRVAIALQWQGSPLKQVPALALHQRGGELQYADHPDTARLKHYAGSISFSPDGSEILVTGPKGGYLLVFDGRTGAATGGLALPQASGVAPLGDKLAVTIAGGLVIRHGGGFSRVAAETGLFWDNHLVPV